MYKSTADHDSGKILYDRYSAVDDEFLALRKTVLARKTPRRMFVQAHTSLTGKHKTTAYRPYNITLLRCTTNKDQRSVSPKTTVKHFSPVTSIPGDTSGFLPFFRKKFPGLFQDSSRTQIDFSRAPKFTLAPALPRSQCQFSLLSSIHFIFFS